jgi:hypothetical protein
VSGPVSTDGKEFAVTLHASFGREL